MRPARRVPRVALTFCSSHSHIEKWFSSPGLNKVSYFTVGSILYAIRRLCHANHALLSCKFPRISFDINQYCTNLAVHSCVSFLFIINIITILMLMTMRMMIIIIIIIFIWTKDKYLLQFSLIYILYKYFNFIHMLNYYYNIN